MTSPRINILQRILEDEKLRKMAQDTTVEGDVDPAQADQIADQIFDQLFDETFKEALKQ